MKISIKQDKLTGKYFAIHSDSNENFKLKTTRDELINSIRNTYPGIDIFDLDTNTWIDLNKQQKLEPATRFDAGKIPYHLFPLDAFEEICKVMQFGAKKYAERNWEQGMSWSRVARSMFSHFISMCRGEQTDPESNLPHAAHMAWNAIVLLTYTLRPKLHNLNDLSNLYSGTKE